MLGDDEEREGVGWSCGAMGMGVVGLFPPIQIVEERGILGGELGI